MRSQANSITHIATVGTRHQQYCWIIRDISVAVSLPDNYCFLNLPLLSIISPGAGFKPPG
ncbi:hypothetical protein [Microseira wollei]|uniref:hypothetical protein n=1 Tax=Microseira wollei TaxID=467598 RepID=UPI001CFD7899|nr:hypothetical protein [Microseira wollei]